MSSIRQKAMSFVVVVFAALLPLAAQAAPAEIQILIDVDHNESSGCRYITPAGMVSGVEVVVAIDYDTATKQVTSETARRCIDPTSNAFGVNQALGTNGWPTGVDDAGNTIIEGRIPSSLFGTTTPLAMRWVFGITSGTANDIIMLNEDDASILFPITLPGKHRAVGSPDTRTIVLDGKLDDWGTIQPFTRAGNGTASLRFQNVYGYADASSVAFAFVVQANNQAPTVFDHEYTVARGGSLNISDPGILDNALNPSGHTLNAFRTSGPQHGTLNVNPGGGFQYLNNGSNASQDDFHFRASDGTNTSNQAKVTLHVVDGASPVITSGSSTTFTVGTNGSFNVTATGIPAPSLSITSGTLPSGVSFIDNGGGHATLSGNPAVGTGGTHTFTITAQNGIPPNANQTFTLTIKEAPAFTSGTTATFQTGVFGSFTITTRGFPRPSIGRTGTLPSGLSFTDNGNGTGTISGTPAAGTGNNYPQVLTATNSLGTANQNLNVVVNQPPQITSANATTFTVGAAGSFNVTTTGFPQVSTITESGALPNGVTFVNNGNGTATLAGTPAAGTGGTYAITITASNGVVPNAIQNFTLTVNEAPAITTAAQNQTVCPGATATFTAAASGFPAPTVQWQVSTNGGVSFNNIPGATSTTLSFTATGADNNNQYRAVFTNSSGTASTTATLTVLVPPAVTTNPVNQTVCAGQTATFTAAASGTPAPTVQWQVSTNGGVSFANIPGATSTTLSFVAAAADNAKQYRAVFTNTCSTATTTAATLTVNVAPAVTAQPVNVTTCTGTTASFTATASGTPSPTVQWQVSTDGGSTFNNIPGATATTYSFSTTPTDDGHQFRAVFTNSCSTATSNAATLTVTTPPAVTTQPANATFCAGTTATFTAAASGNPSPTVQWQVSTDGGSTFNNIPGATSTTLSFTASASDDGHQYKAIFTNSCGTAASNAATITVNIAPAVTTNPSSQLVCAGGTATFTAAASGTPAPTVQWQVSNGGPFTDIPGATSTTLSFASVAGDNGKQYRAVFTNSCSSANSNPATLTVDTLPVVSVNPAPQSICAGAPVSFTSAATSNNNDHTVQWQVSTDGGTTFNNIPGATSGTLTFTTAAADNGKQYRAVFTDACGFTNSNAATLTVDTLPVVNTQPVSQAACAGNTVSFTSTATSNASDHVVQWQVSTDGGTNWNNIPGATSTTLSFTAAFSQNGNQYRAVFSDACGSTNSNVATLTLNDPPAVTTNPVTQTACDGTQVTFTAAASGSPTPTVQWQVSIDGGATFNDIPGATSTSLTFTVSPADNGHQYHAVFTNVCSTATTTNASLTVTTTPVVTGNPAPQTVCSGNTATFTASTSTAGATVQWQLSTDGGTTFNDISGATSTTLSFTTAFSQNGNQYRAVFTSFCGTSNTTAATLTVNVAAAVTSNPVDQTVCAGSSASFTATASGTPAPTVQWQVSIDGGTTFNDIPGATSTTLSFVTAPGDNGHKFRARFTNSCASNVATTAATLTVDTLPVITTNPLTQTLCAGATVTFTAAATSNASDHTVQWQVSTDGGTTFNDIPGATSTTLSFVTTTGDNGHKYRAVFTDVCGSTNTTAATLTVDTLPVVSAQPAPQTVCAGATATFTSTATSNANDHTVQWQVSTDGGTTFNNIPGATSTTLSFATVAADNGKQYRAVFTDACGSTNSNAATLTVNTPPAVTTQPTNQTLCAGATATFTAAASGSPAPTVQWQVSTDGGTTFNDIPGATSTTLSFATVAADNGKQYRARFTNTCAANVATNAATLTVNTAPAVTTQPTNQTVCAGANATFTAAASGSPAPTVQWQKSTDGGATFNDIVGATSTTLTFATVAGDNNNQYRARFTNACGVNVTTNAATLTVNTAPVVTTQPLTQTVCSGNTATFTAAASGSPAPTVQWQVSTDGGTTFNDIVGQTTTTLSFTAVAADTGKQYRARFTNSCAANVATNAATLTVNTPPSVTTQPTNQTVVAGTTATFTSAASGTPAPTVQWQVSTDSGATFNDIPGATSTTLTLNSVTIAMNGNQYRARFTNSCQANVASNAATLTVTCPTFTFAPNGTMPTATFSVAYSQNITVSGTTANPVTIAVTSGAIPGSFTFTDNGNGTATIASANPTVTGNFSFTVTATDGAGCSTPKAFTMAVQPKVVDDNYSQAAGQTGNAVGNTQAMVTGYTPAPAANEPFATFTGTVLANDGGPSIAVTTTTVSNAGGSITFTPTGEFLYTPALGFTGTAIFGYTVSSNGVSASGNVNIVVSNKVLYVRNDYTGGTADGRSNTPFKTLATAITASAVNDLIYIFNGDGTSTGYDGNFTLKTGQTVLGEGVALSVNNYTLRAAGTKPRLTDTTPGVIMQVAQNDTVRGIHFASTNAAAIINTGNALGAINLGDNLIDGTGGAFNFTTTAAGSGSVTIDNSTVNFAAGTAGMLSATTTNVTVTLNVNNTISYTGASPVTISSSASSTFLFNGAMTLNANGSGNSSINISGNTNTPVTFAGNLTLNPTGSASNAILINNNALGAGTPTITFSGTLSIVPGAGIAGISVTNNSTTASFSGSAKTITTSGNAVSMTTSSGILDFTGGGLVITTTGSATGYVVSGGGTTSVLGSGNTISTQTGLALSDTSVAIGGSGITFASVSTNGAATGISFANCGGGNVTINGGTLTTTTTGLSLSTIGAGTTTLANVTISGPVTGISGTSFQTLNLNSDTISGVTGTGVTLTTGTLGGTGSSISSTGQGLIMSGVAVASGTTMSSVSSGGGANGISLTNVTGNSLVISGGTLANNTTAGFFSNGGTTSVTYAGNINTSTAASFLVDSTARSGGTLTFSGTLGGAATAAGAGIRIQNSTGTTVYTFSGTQTLGTSGSRMASTAVTIAGNNSTTTLNFSGTLSIFTGAFTAFTATGPTGGTINFSGTDSIDSSASALSLTGVALGAGTLSNLTAAGGVNGVALTTVTGGTLTISAGSISGATGAAFLVSGGSVSVTDNGTISQATAAQPLVSVAAGHTGTLTFGGNVTATNGTGLQFDNADGTYNFNGTTNSLSGGNAGVDILNGSTGTFSFSSGTSITNPTGSAFHIDTSSPSVTYAGTITQNTAGQRAIDITVLSGANTVTFSGSITSNGGAGVSAEGTGGTVTMSGALSLSGGGSIFKACSGTCASPTGSGLTINVTNANNFVGGTTASPSAATTTAVLIDHATIGAANVKFLNVNVTGGSKGIVLNNTGATGTFSITGTGTTAGTGGTIQNTSNRGAEIISANNVTLKNMNFTNANTANGDVAATCANLGGGTNLNCGAAIHLATVNGFSIDNVDVNGSAQVGINGNNVTAFSMTNGSKVRNCGNESNENGMQFANLLGTSTITNATFSANYNSGLDVVNTVSTAGTLNITNAAFTGNGIGTHGSTLIKYSGDGTANMTVNIQSSSFNGSNSYGYFTDTATTAHVTSTINNCTFGTVSANALGVEYSDSGSSDIDFTVTNNTIVGGDALNGSIWMAGFSETGITTASASLNGTFDGNHIGTPGVTGSGCKNNCGGVGILPAGAGAMNLTITNNQIYQVSHGIDMSSNAGTTGVLTLHIRGNTLAEPVTGFSFIRAIAVSPGNSGGASPTSCLEIGGSTAGNKNTVSGAWQASAFFRINNQNNTGTTRFPGYAGSATDQTALQNFVEANNTGVTGNTTITPGTGINGGAACP